MAVTGFPRVSSSLRRWGRWAVLVVASTLAAASSCQPPITEGEGESEEELCIIGDPDAPAELQLVYRTVDETVADLEAGAEVPLILPPQGGKVVLIGVRARNVTCRASLNAGLLDTCSKPDPVIIGREGRPIELVEQDDGFGYPAAPDTLQNYANIPICPTFVSSRDGDGQPYDLELRLTEGLRPGEDRPRTHVLTTTVTPVCGEPGIEDDCRCECDADLILDVPREEQCPTIHDNDLPAGVCPA